MDGEKELKKTVTNLQKLLSNAEEYFDSLETEDAPSGEWEEYNVDWLKEESYVAGIKDAVVAVGSCEECGFSMSSGRGKDYRDCKKGNGIHKKDWYCADFRKGNCSKCAYSEPMRANVWCSLYERTFDWDDICAEFKDEE